MLVDSESPVAASVIIGSVNGGPWIHVLLDALELQQGSTDFEVIVADRCVDGTADRILREHPKVQVLRLDPDIVLPELRTRALERSRADIILVTEDHTVPPPNWIELARSELDRAPAELAGVGVPVENQMCGRAVDWAAFFCEYSGYLPPQARGEVDDIPGMNIAYRRNALDAPRDLLIAGFWESTLHPRLVQAGRRFLRVPELVIGHRKRFGFGYFIAQRYQYSRHFAGSRFPRSAVTRRILYALLSPALAIVVPTRVLRAVWPRRELRAPALRSLPSLACFSVAWAVGEFVGYLAGPGRSLVAIQ